MAARHDILDRRESFQKPVVFSVGLHAAFLLAGIIYAILPVSEVVQWGDPNSLGGGAMSITPVNSVPLPGRSGQINPVANDTESRVPSPPPDAERQRRDEVEEEEEAIPIQSRNAPPPKPRQRRRSDPSPTTVPKENQIYSSSGAAMTSPMYGSTSSGSGGVGIGSGNPFGSRFGAYEAILRQKVGQAWNTGQVDPRLQTAPIVIVTFEILRNGSVRNVRFMQRSGHSSLDFSCQRAILDASPFPPLPAGFQRDVARIEFWFELKR
jgi:protein TonB